MTKRFFANFQGFFSPRPRNHQSYLGGRERYSGRARGGRLGHDTQGNKERETMQERALFMVILSYSFAQDAFNGQLLTIIPVFRKGRLSSNPEFHLGPAEKGTGALPPCLEVLPDLRSLCVFGLSDPETLDSFP
jgi:hypothetical protein